MDRDSIVNYEQSIRVEPSTQVRYLACEAPLSAGSWISWEAKRHA
jgi:hypothetical protein